MSWLAVERRKVDPLAEIMWRGIVCFLLNLELKSSFGLCRHTRKHTRLLFYSRSRNVAFSPPLSNKSQKTHDCPRPLLPHRHSSVSDRGLSGKLDFLEADPYYDMSNIPVNTYKAKDPMIGKVVSVKRIVGPEATGETCDVVISHGGKMPYWEGQSYGVIPPGNNWKTGKPNGVRLYSIASSR